VGLLENALLATEGRNSAGVLVAEDDIAKRQL
jgi:hypothetical protein